MTEPPPKPKKKNYRVVWALREQGAKTRWTRIGIARENRDGSLNLYLDALPIGDRLQVREPNDEVIGRRPGRFTELPDSLAG